MANLCTLENIPVSASAGSKFLFSRKHLPRKCQSKRATSLFVYIYMMRRLSNIPLFLPETQFKIYRVMLRQRDEQGRPFSPVSRCLFVSCFST